MTGAVCPGRVVYSYAVTRPFDGARLADVRGVDGAAVHLVHHEDLVAVVSLVPCADFGGAALQSRLEDLSELEALARGHHAVVEAVAAIGAALPFRLATVHRTTARVAEVLRRRHRPLAATLDRLADRVEVGVKLYTVASDEFNVKVVPVPDTGSSSPGRDYLRRRRDQTRRQEDGWQHMTAIAQRVGAELAARADDHRGHRPQDRRWNGTADGGENVLNASYLVAVGDVDAFTAFVSQLCADIPGVRAVTTGPWAPYSFAEVPDSFCDRYVSSEHHPPPDPTLPPCAATAAPPLCSWVAVTEPEGGSA